MSEITAIKSSIDKGNNYSVIIVIITIIFKQAVPIVHGYFFWNSTIYEKNKNL